VLALLSENVVRVRIRDGGREDAEPTSSSLLVRTAIAATRLRPHRLLAGFRYDVGIESKRIPSSPQKKEKTGSEAGLTGDVTWAYRGRSSPVARVGIRDIVKRRIDVSGSRTGVDELHRYGYETLQVIKAEQTQ
jgi:hypothetical protein